MNPNFLKNVHITAITNNPFRHGWYATKTTFLIIFFGVRHGGVIPKPPPKTRVMLNCVYFFI